MWKLFYSAFSSIKGLVDWTIKSSVSLSFRYPLFLAYMGSIIALSGIFYLGISVLLLALDLVFPSQYLDLVAPIFPRNMRACMSIVLSVRLIALSLSWSFRFKSEIHKMAQDASRRS